MVDKAYQILKWINIYQYLIKTNFSQEYIKFQIEIICYLLVLASFYVVCSPPPDGKVIIFA